MALTYGFYNSVDSDRTYDAQQMGQIFKGIITDGIFKDVGEALRVTADGTSMQVKVGTGRCWFEDTWTDNSSTMFLDVDASDALYERRDLVCVEVNKRVSDRKNDIKIIKGIPNENPTDPSLQTVSGIFLYPIARVNVRAGVSKISLGDVVDLRGVGKAPWITGPLETIDMLSTMDMANDQWSNFFKSKQDIVNSDSKEMMSNLKDDFSSWFDEVKGSLDANYVTALAGKVIELEHRLGYSETGNIIYDDLEDQSGNSITDSNNRNIQGKIIYVRI